MVSSQNAAQVLQVNWLESDRDGRGAEERERKKGDRLIVAANGPTTDGDDGNGRNDEPERRENRAGNAGSDRRNDRREHHDGETEQDERLTRSQPAHGVQVLIVSRAAIRTSL